MPQLQITVSATKHTGATVKDGDDMPTNDYVTVQTLETEPLGPGHAAGLVYDLLTRPVTYRESESPDIGLPVSITVRQGPAFKSRLADFFNPTSTDIERAERTGGERMLMEALAEMRQYVADLERMLGA